jgi:hypothetical protein
MLITISDWYYNKSKLVISQGTYAAAGGRMEEK